MKFVVIGITDSPQPFFTPEVGRMIGSGRVFSGGRRHHDIVAPLLPDGAEWIDITVPLDAVFERYAAHFSAKVAKDGALGEDFCGDAIIVFASGDPLFFGFANTLRRKLPQAEVVVFPAFNSLQLLAHRLLMPYHDMRIVSLTGRPWAALDRALIELRTAAPHQQQIGILTDREHTPAAIARRMLDYGYCDYEMFVGERLGNPALERVTALNLDEASRQEFLQPNCVIVTAANASATASRPSPEFGIADASFALLDGRKKMLTKMPIRLLTLQALDLPRRRVFWDIGACTGSVSIEARLLFPHLSVAAFEVRPECEAIISENARRHGAPGIDVHIGDFLTFSLSALAPPDAVFIGGHGGRLKEIMAAVLTVLAPGGVIVFNCVTSVVAAQLTGRTSSRQLWDEACAELHLSQAQSTRVVLDDNNPIEILKAWR